MMHDRALALAGLAQALHQVRRVADTGQVDAAVLETAMRSVFRIEADSPLDVYGAVDALAPGLRLVQRYLGSRGEDQLLPRLALSVTQLERRFVREEQIATRVRDGILAAEPAADRLGHAHPEVLATLGNLYAETVSHLRPRILVQGNPHYLGQPDIVAEIRAILLAALRSAVLWRQVGGSMWDFLLRRRQLQQAIESVRD
ncbi:high frequency lysogenization protein HflD [Luteimonas vadosa]|uniref:High frequency lysogenization protein HflD homolog n=2 Tax=Luteimonas vadosa TaxID=1165507 RepID=A0ABP9E3N8_9GAMM